MYCPRTWPCEIRRGCQARFEHCFECKEGVGRKRPIYIGYRSEKVLRILRLVNVASEMKLRRLLIVIRSEEHDSVSAFHASRDVQGKTRCKPIRVVLSRLPDEEAELDVAANGGRFEFELRGGERD